MSSGERETAPMELPVTKTISMTLSALFVLACTSGCLSQTYCQRAAECEDDPPGEDFVRVCQARYDGTVSALRANKEDECHALANAKETFDACSAQLDDCDEFQRAGSNNYDGECEDEHDAYMDALEDAENECGTLD